MTTIARAQMEVHKAAQVSILAAYRNEALYEDAKEAIELARSGQKPIERAALLLK